MTSVTKAGILSNFDMAGDLTMEEIGTIYGVSKAAVSKRLKKLHEQLRDSVK